VRDELWSLRLKRWGWACADILFHLTFTLAIVLLGLLQAICGEIADTWHGICKTWREWRGP
jgi:hypothetical protein